MPILTIRSEHSIIPLQTTPQSKNYVQYPNEICCPIYVEYNICMRLYFDAEFRHCATLSLMMPCPVKYRCNPLTNSSCSSGDSEITAVCKSEPTVTCLTAIKL